MKFEYSEKIIALCKHAEKVNEEKLVTLAEKIAENIENDKIIYVFGTGHSYMAGLEMFFRAGGLGNVCAMLDPDVLVTFGARRSGPMEQTPGVADVIYNTYGIEAGDMMIINTNSGRNAMPIEMAARAQKEDVFTVVITNMNQSKSSTSRHPSGKKAYEYADLIIDNCCPIGDGMMDIDGIKTGPASTIVVMFLLNIAITEAMKLVVSRGRRPYVFQSQNVDGYNNAAIYEKYGKRIKHL
ncbi:MAG TPA: SIS domain-containing protein [Erysipelotrichaceae bacterium]|nr:SIS domain-containing protein [Erysipelotrichaceae bacterium]HQB32478.1 SIS domain-containing protein [Erysipelotrichaceae bacterium]